MSKKERRVWLKVTDTSSCWLHDRPLCPSVFHFRTPRIMLHLELPFSHVTTAIDFYGSANSDLKLWDVTRVSQARAGGLLMTADFSALAGHKGLCQSRLVQSDVGSFVFLTQCFIPIPCSRLNKGYALLLWLYRCHFLHSCVSSGLSEKTHNKHLALKCT